MRSKLIFAAVLSAVAAFALLPRSATAVTKISHVRVAADETGTDAGEVFIAQGSPESVWVLYDYSDASPGTRIAVHVIGHGVTLFREEERYEGDGTAAVEVSGDAVYATIGEALADAAALLQAGAAMVQREDVTPGRLDHELNQMIMEANGAGIVVPLVARVEDDDVRESASRLDEVLARIEAKLEAALDTPYDEIAKRQAALAGMADDAAELESLVDRLADLLGERSGLRLPAMGPQWFFDVSVRITEGSARDVPAGSAWFYVVHGAGRVYLPFGASGP
jgi:hypothetical protein